MAVRKGKTQTDYLAEENRDLFWTSMWSTAEEISKTMSEPHNLGDYAYDNLFDGPVAYRESKRYGRHPVWGKPTGRYAPKNGGYCGSKRGSTRKMCRR